MARTRGLKVRRISRDEETSASLIAQDERIDAYADTNGIELVDDVEDATVSGKVNPDKRKPLGKWLKEPLLSRWDVLIFTNQDRITRDEEPPVCTGGSGALDTASTGSLKPLV
ncbi:recombinase family protein [Streptomyces sp. CA-294286]|uniref:recombinase family protein n=1 Tax=Streptomyces sp. CA-294286 TaxID=3240070 RepID=UPI003D8E2F30